MKLITKFYVVLIALTLIGSQLRAQNYIDNWPNWRGPNFDGNSPNGTPPTEWSETKNIKWKTPIPGKGLGTPIVWGDQIFITTAIELDEKATEEAIKKLKKTHPTFMKVMGMSGTTENLLQFVVYSINRETGEINWQKVVREQFPYEGMNDQGSWASASCVTDGEHMIAHFGSYGTYCFDMNGTLIWETDLGDMKIYNAFGEGSSPFIYKDKLVIVWDHLEQSKIFVLNKITGKEVWQKDRKEASTWVSPIVVEINGKDQIIVPGDVKSFGYDLENGDIIWELAGLGAGPISCPVFDGERAFLMSGYGKVKIIQAVNLKTAKGDIENTESVVWTIEKITSYVPSPLLVNDKLYFLRGSFSVLTCVDTKTGKIFYETQKPKGMGGAYASPVSANGNIYILDRKGNSSVIKEGTNFKVIATNKLDDNFDSSPVVVGKDLFLRGYKSLYCISE
ncbi:PQQ-binding-like beta-propeller repeat protein [Bacteroidota bacterium]